MYTASGILLPVQPMSDAVRQNQHHPGEFHDCTNHHHWKAPGFLFHSSPAVVPLS